MGGIGERALREQLIERRQRLQAALPASDDSELMRLLSEVDAALERMDAGAYGICEVCHGPVESDRLMMDPLTRFCLAHLTPEQQRALEQDLELAANIQRRLLPAPDLRFAGWQVCYHYQPLGPVSGDYCDAVKGEDAGNQASGLADARPARRPDSLGDSNLLLLLGDVSGKGVAASMLMAHLNAMFRSLSGFSMPVCDMMERANRLFCESTLASHFATLVCMRAHSSGEVEICNAGHSPVAFVSDGDLSLLDSEDLPLGMFSNAHYSSRSARLQEGDTLLVYTDGLSEARDARGVEYGDVRLKSFAGRSRPMDPSALISAWMKDVQDFCAGTSLADDLTAMVVRRL